MYALPRKAGNEDLEYWSEEYLPSFLLQFKTLSFFQKGCIEGLIIFFLIFISIYIDERKKRGK
jgi:hypothetical protein